MYNGIKNIILKVLKVPEEPLDPMGDVRSLIVFRASPNYYRYKFFFWIVKTAGLWIVAVLVAAFAMLSIPSSFSTVDVAVSIVVALSVLAGIIFRTVTSYFLMRLEYELRWYKVSDRSLRIRQGVTKVKELTMTFANIQKLSISQGPLQRIFGIADLRVESAGGGGLMDASSDSGHQVNDAHAAYFRGLDNAAEIKQLISGRLKKLKDSGLGQEEGVTPISDKIQKALPRSTMNLLNEIRTELRGFRRAVEKATPEAV